MCVYAQAHTHKTFYTHDYVLAAWCMQYTFLLYPTHEHILTHTHSHTKSHTPTNTTHTHTHTYTHTHIHTQTQQTQQTSSKAGQPWKIKDQGNEKGSGSKKSNLLIKRFTERNAANCVWALGTLHQQGVQVLCVSIAYVRVCLHVCA